MVRSKSTKKTELNFDKNKIKKFFRLKNKSNNSAQNSKPRPIIIEFNETSERDNLVIASNKKKITDIFKYRKHVYLFK